MVQVQNRLPSRYRILEEVGQGGMAVVYRATDEALKREVAIKVLHPHLLAEMESKSRLEREAQAVAKLRHDNILQIFDYSGMDSPSSYIVTEFIDGPTLKQFLADRKLPAPEIGALIALEMGGALAHAHAAGIIHRDVKPENVMVRRDGLLKLMDFGVAQIVDLERMTVTGQLLGSPAYMAPEMLEGKPLDFRTDVFSVGIMLYQLTTGALPFSGRNPHEVLKRIAEGRFTDPRTVNRMVPDRLARIIGKALAKKPEDRYQTMVGFVDDLKSFVGDAGFDSSTDELRQFFCHSEVFEARLFPRMVKALAASGKREQAAGRTARALELWNRALAIDANNREVIRELRRLEGRQRVKRSAVVLGSAALIGLSIWAALRLGTRDQPGPDVRLSQNVSPAEPAPAAVVPGFSSGVSAPPAARESKRSPLPKGTQGRSSTSRPDKAAPPPVPRIVHPGPAVSREFALGVTPQLLDVHVDGLPPFKTDMSHRSVVVDWTKKTRIDFSSPSDLYEPTSVVVGPDEDLRDQHTIVVKLKPKTAKVHVQIRPPEAGVTVLIEESKSARKARPWRWTATTDEMVDVPFDVEDNPKKMLDVTVSSRRGIQPTRPFEVMAGHTEPLNITPDQ